MSQKFLIFKKLEIYAEIFIKMINSQQYPKTANELEIYAEIYRNEIFKDIQELPVS